MKKAVEYERSADGRIIDSKELFESQRLIDVESVKCPTCMSEDCTLITEAKDYEYASSGQNWRVCECNNCHTLYLNPRPAIDAMHHIYPKNYYSYSSNIDRSTSEGIVQRVWKWLEQRKARQYLQFVNLENMGVKRALDVGCGDGRFILNYKSVADNNWELHGIEIGDCDKKYQIRDGVKYYNGTVEELDESLYGSYDIIWLQQVIEHVPVPRTTIEVLYKLLKKNGVLILETPDTHSWDNSVWNRKYWGGYHIPRHFSLWNKSNLSKLLVSYGFSIVNIRSILSPVFWVLSVRNWAINTEKSKFLVKMLSPLNPIVMSIATGIDIVQILLFKRSSNQQIVVRKT